MKIFCNVISLGKYNKEKNCFVLFFLIPLISKNVKLINSELSGLEKKIGTTKQVILNCSESIFFLIFETFLLTLLMN